MQDQEPPRPGKLNPAVPADLETICLNLPARSGSSGMPLGLAFSPDIRTLAYNENEHGAITLWDIVSRSVIGRLTGHRSYVTALAFSPDGQTPASGSQDRTARLWSLAKRRQSLQLTNQ